MQRLNWLPSGKHAAVCFSVDDIHPSRSSDDYEAGGDLGRGGLGRVEQLLADHPALRVTLFVTPDWRPRGLVRSRHLASRIPFLRERVYWSSRQPRDRMRIDRHPELVAYLNSLPRAEVAMHGLHHSHPGPRLATEFQNQTREECRGALRKGREIFARAGLESTSGFAPPAWNLPAALAEALADQGFTFVSSARDVITPVAPDAVTAMSGLNGVSLIHPERIMASRLIHFSTNFQASSPIDRAIRIIDSGGLLSIKAHIFKSGGGHTMIDGLDALYVNYLDLIFTTLESRYGDELWWTSMGEISQRLKVSK